MPYIREIVKDGHPALRKVAKRVEPDELRSPLFQQLIDDMFETMYEAPGIGLAAPQIAVSKRVFVVDLQDEKLPGTGPLALINPRLTVTEGEIDSVEGCLSIPGLVGDLKRYEHVVCSALDRHGKRIEIDGRGLFGRCLQHELDHLDGILYTDKATNVRPVERDEDGGARSGDDAGGSAAEVGEAGDAAHVAQAGGMRGDGDAPAHGADAARDREAVVPV